MNLLKETTEKRIRFWSEFALLPFWLFYALYYYYKINYFNYISYLFAAVSIVSNIVIIKNSFNKRKIEKLEFEQYLIDKEKEDKEYMDRYNKRRDNLGGEGLEKQLRKFEFDSRYTGSLK